MMLQCSNRFLTSCRRMRPNDLSSDVACGCTVPRHRGNISRCSRRTRSPIYPGTSNVRPLWTRQKTIGDAAAARICTTHWRCPKEYVLFAAKDGAGEHCEAGAREVFFQKMFDWLDPILAE